MRRSVPLLLVRYLFLAGAMIVLNFWIPRVLPGDPLAASLNGGLDVAAPISGPSRERLAAYYQLDQPRGRQFVHYLDDLLHGNLGWSISHAHPVSQMILQRLPWTLGLMLASLLLATTLGTTAGLLASWVRSRPLERLTVSLAALLAALPEFLIAIMLLLIFGIGLNWFPLGGGHTVFRESSGGLFGAMGSAVDVLWHLLLPVLALALAGSAGFFLIAYDLTGGMRQSAWLSLARAKGLSESRVVMRHVLPNAALPLLTFFGLRLGAVFGGAMVIEQVFNIPGLGQLAFQSVEARDYPILQAVFLLSGLGLLLVNLGLDLITLHASTRERWTGV